VRRRTVSDGRERAGPRTGRGARDQRGTSTVEYSLTLALVAVVSAGAMLYLGRAINNTLTAVAAQIAGDILPVGAFDSSSDDPGAPLCPTSSCTIILTGESSVYFAAPEGIGQVVWQYQPQTLPHGVSFSQNPNECGLYYPLCMVATGLGSGPTPIAVTATDSTGASGTLDLSLLVLRPIGSSGSNEPSVKISDADCSVSVSSYLSGCVEYTWLDGLYIDDQGQWMQIEADPGTGQISDLAAFAYGTSSTGREGTGPWKCGSMSGPWCRTLDTNIFGAADFALGTASST
jgi:Flp pilus assembly pilin Flp